MSEAICVAHAASASDFAGAHPGYDSPMLRDRIHQREAALLHLGERAA
jgi:hypothetical protein